MPASILTDFYHDILTRNWFAGAALAIMIGTQILKSLPWLREKIWAKVPTGYRFLVPTLAAALTAFVHGYLAHETAGASIWDALKIALSAMGGAAALKESPLPWGNTGPGGAPLPSPSPDPARLASAASRATQPSSLPIIPPLADAVDEDKTPIDPRGSPPPTDPPNAA